MKNYIQITIILLSTILASCTDVIDVPVQTDPARLTIEASLDWVKGTAGNNQTIKLSTSTAFFDTTSNTAVTGASVKVTNDSSAAEFIFTDQNNGEYTTDKFVPKIGQSYTLEIVYNGEIYTAQETLNAVPDITNVYQSREDGFDDELLEVHVQFTDPVDKKNQYLFKFKEEGELLPVFLIADDQFVNGNELNWWHEIAEDKDTDKIEAFQPGDVLSIEMYGISEAYFNYMEILIDQIGGVGLFEATPVAVKSNCVNKTTPDNYAHGYFRLTQVNKVNYTFE